MRVKRSLMLRRTSKVVTGVIFLAFLLYAPKIVEAQDSQASRSIAVTPPSFELFANPGESVSDKIRVRNDSGIAQTYHVVVEDFKAVGEEGSIDLVTEDQSNMGYSLAKWVVPEPKTFSLDAHEEKEIPFTINVPKNAEPGGHYASVLVNMGGETKVSGGAAVTSRVGSLILLRVSGNVQEDARVESFAAAKGYYEKGPVDFELRVKNNGNNHIRPKGTIVITNIFGQKVTEVELNGLNILPDAIRKMNTEWKFSALLANRYTATLVATYGQQNKPLSASSSFIIFPKPLLAVAGVIILFLLFLIFGRRKVKRILHNLTK